MIMPSLDALMTLHAGIIVVWYNVSIFYDEKPSVIYSQLTLELHI